MTRTRNAWRLRRTSRALPAALLGLALSAAASPLDQPVDLPNLVFAGRKAAIDFPPVQLPPLTFAGRQEAVLPQVQMPALQFAGRGDPKGIDPVTSPTLNFKGRLPQ